MKRWFFMLGLALLALPQGLFAQYTGPGAAQKFYTVKEVRSQAMRLDRNDELIKVSGYVVNQLNSDLYQFKDETGSINVEIKKKYMPEVAFDEKTKITIIGEVDYDLLEGIEIEVEEIQVE